MKKYPIWVGGYAITGNEGKAQLAGYETGETFKEAATKFFAGKESSWGKFDPDRMTVWGCKVTDDETEARKHFG